MNHTEKKGATHLDTATTDPLEAGFIAIIRRNNHFWFREITITSKMTDVSSTYGSNYIEIHIPMDQIWTYSIMIG